MPLIGILTAMLAAAGSASQPSSDPTIQAVRDEVYRANAAYAANDLPAYWSTYAEDLTQWWPEGRVDLPTYRKQWEQFIAAGGRVERAEVSDLRIQLSPAGDAAVASYLLHVATRGSDGSLTEEAVHETDVLFLRDGAWKVVHLHYSPVQPPPSAPSP